MSGTSRLEKIEAMLDESPSDTFLRYSLAMECQKERQADRSLALFRELAQDDPPYVPAMFMGGKLLIELGRIDDARAMLRAGIEAARKQGNEHAASEMSETLAMLGSLGD